VPGFTEVVDDYLHTLPLFGRPTVVVELKRARAEGIP
jgi:hypothetical protein